MQLGTNVGDRWEQLHKAKKMLSSFCSIEAEGDIFETAAWGKTDQASFYNQLIQIDHASNPYDLLKQCQYVEKEMGRKKSEHWGPRIIDIDIIFYRNKIIFSPELIIPHQHIHRRRFILEPLKLICPKEKLPFYDQTAAELLAKCEDTGSVNVI